MNNTWKVILATLVIYGAGVMTGGLLVNLTAKSKPRAPLPPQPIINIQRPEFLRRLDRQLALTQEQFETIEEIINESNDRTKALWEPIAPALKAELREVHDKIRAVLTADQRKKFEEEILRPRPARKSDPTPQRSPPNLPGPPTSTNP